MERSTILMGNSTISTGPFLIAMLVYQRVATKNGGSFHSFLYVYQSLTFIDTH